jgi:hypothetical protein
MGSYYLRWYRGQFGIHLGWYVLSFRCHTDQILKLRLARNLKFYPLALSQAIKKGNLDFIKDKFEVETCKDGKKNFASLETWDLLNLKLETVLDLPEQLYKEFGISSDYLKDALDKYNIQSAGLIPDETEQLYESLKPMKYLLAKTRHYSWPKGLGMWLFNPII